MAPRPQRRSAAVERARCSLPLNCTCVSPAKGTRCGRSGCLFTRHAVSPVFEQGLYFMPNLLSRSAPTADEFIV